MKYEFSIRQISAQPTMSIRGRTTRSALALTIGEFLAHIRAYIERSGVTPGVPYTRYYSMQGDDIDVEAGFRIETPLPGDDRIQARELPGGDVAVTVHHGPYEGLEAAADALATWVRGQGRESAGPNWEVYVTHRGRETDAAKWITELYRPLK